MNQTWYHGGPELRTRFTDQRMERDLTTESALQEGPGIYWTTSYDEAAGYGPHVVEIELSDSFRLMPRKQKATLRTLMDVYELADPYHQETFLADFDTEDPKVALRPYTRQESLHDALVTLYGDLFHNDPHNWLEAVRSLGYDGIVIPVRHGVEHLVVWNPERIYRVREAEPPPEENPRLKERLLRL